ncbi:hypothetical protein BOO94_14190 [Pseudomonas sp. FSL W5-0299]|jgi:transposase|nr:ISPpu13, transposase Orf2 [Pseudomonas sp. G5(2012)]OOL37078.1 hypothetical protein BOO94_14190 [Pseudomonas sp. FSL W5-0299]
MCSATFYAVVPHVRICAGAAGNCRPYRDPTKRRGKRKPLPAYLPRIEVIHELPDHELSCACGCRKHSIGEEISEQLEIVPMQIRVIKHVRKVYACRGCETALVTAEKPVQLIEKSMASSSVLAMLLTTKYVDGL